MLKIAYGCLKLSFTNIILNLKKTKDKIHSYEHGPMMYFLFPNTELIVKFNYFLKMSFKSIFHRYLFLYVIIKMKIRRVLISEKKTIIWVKL